MNYIRKFFLRLHKKKALVEVRADIKFIEVYRKEWLEYDEKNGRSILRREDAKGDKKDQVVVDSTSKDIASHLATKKELQQLQEMEVGLIRYINLI